MIEHKAYILANYDKYGIMVSDSFRFDPEKARPLTRQEMLGLLNILDAHGENLDSFHDASFNGADFFCEIYGSFEDDNDTYNALMQFNQFFTDEEFIDWMLEHIEDEIDNYGNYEDAMEFIKDVAFDNACDESIIKTEDGYVIIVRYWYKEVIYYDIYN